MKLVAFNGSPRKDGNTHIMIQHVFEVLETEGINCEEIIVGGQMVRGCTACMKCITDLGQCAIKEDKVNEWIEKMKGADAIIMASPTYFANITSEMKALIDRSGMVNHCGGNYLTRKVGAPIAVARRGGAIQVYNTLMAFFGISEMIVPMSSYWNMGYGLAKADINTDDKAISTMKTLGANIAYVLKALHK